MRDEIVEVLVGTRVLQGQETVTVTIGAYFSPSCLSIFQTTVVTADGEVGEKDDEHVLLDVEQMDRLIELYQQYRQEHEERPSGNPEGLTVFPESGN